MCCLVYCNDRLFTFSGHERLMITAVFYLLRQKKSAEFLQAMEEDR